MNRKKNHEEKQKKIKLSSTPRKKKTVPSLKKKIKVKVEKVSGILPFFDTIFEKMPYGVAVTDSKGNFLKTNKIFIDLFRSTPRKEYGMFDDPVMRKAGFGKLLEKARSGKYVEVPEIWFDIREYYPELPSYKVCLRAIVYPILNKKKIENFILVIENITDKKTIEQELHRSSEKYRRIFENIQDVYYEVSMDGSLIEISPSIESFTKYKRSELIGVDITKLYADSTDREVFLRELSSKGYVRNYILRLKDKDGRVIICSASSKLLFDEDKKPSRIIGALNDISEHQKMVEILKLSEERYREIFEGASELVWTSDLEGNILSVNPVAEKEIGYKTEEILGMNIRQLFTKESFQNASEKIRYKLDKPNESSLYEIEVVAKNGDHLFYEVNSKLRIRNNMPQSIFGIARNITERKKAEEELNKTREKYIELFDSTNDIIYTMDFKGNFTSVNKTAEKLLGLRFSDLTDVNMRSYLTPESAWRALADVVKKLRGLDENTVYEVDFIKKNGGIVTFEINSQVRYKSGKPFEVFGIARDVTERKKAIEALRNSEEKYRMIFENAPLGIMTADIRGNIIEINPVLLQMLGSKSAKDTKNINVLSFPPMILAGLVEKFVTCIETGEPVISEHTYTSMWGKTLDTRIYTKPIKNPHGKITGFQTIVEDITEQKHIEKQIREALSEKEVLIREIHHRVKNNMQIIISLINMQMQDISDIVMIRKFRELQHRVRSMSIIHEDLYMSDDLSRINFGSYLERLTNHLMQAYPHKNNLQLKIDVSDVLLGIDTAIPCGLIVNELLSNSLKYAFPDDKFSDDSKCRINIDFTSEKNNYKLIVEDNGIGLPPDIEKIKEKSLGLMLVEILLTQLKGNMNISGKKGTRFEMVMEKEKSRR